MCRLFAYIATKQSDINPNLFPICQSFYSLAQNGNVLTGSDTGHQDGFGIHIERESDQYTYKTSDSASLSHPMMSHIDAMLSGAQLVSAHVRKKTNTDGEITMQNNHPFVHSGLTFMHNGAVKIGFSEPYEDVACLCSGETDTERMFEHMLEKKLQGTTTEEAWVSTLKEISEMYNESYTALNTILTTPEYVYVSRIVNEKHTEYVQRNFDAYFTLYISNETSGIYVCSEQIESNSIVWKPIGNNSYIKIDRKSGDITHI